MPPSHSENSTVTSKEDALKILAALSADDREWVVKQQKVQEESLALRARLPSFLGPSIANIAAAEPSRVQKVKRANDGHNGAFKLSESWSLLVISPPNAPKKHLEIQVDSWYTYLRGAVTNNNTISLKYGAADAWKSAKSSGGVKRGEAHACSYSDPGMGAYSHASKGVKEIVADVARDMGYVEEFGDAARMKLLNALIGTKGADLLRGRLREEEEPSLRRIIRKDLEKDISD